METTSYDNFASLDIRVGRIIEAKKFARARNPSYKVAVQFGDEDIRWSSAQITHYDLDQLIGKQVVCVTNLPERNIAGFMSQVLILGAKDNKGDVILLSPESEVTQGQKVF